jgi:Ca2+-binding EF-hand superfamily protein
MRALLISLFILALPSAAIAQGGMGGGMGGMGSGSMGSGGMGNGGGGRRGGGMQGGMGGGEGRRGPGNGEGPAQMKPISREKMDKPIEEMFRAADVNKDGTVQLDELRAVLNAKREMLIHDRFKKIDANGDKLIDEKEFIAWQQSMGSLAASEAEGRGSGFGIVTESLPPPLGDGRDDQVLRIIIEPLTVDVLVSANVNYDKGVTLPELLAYEHLRFDAADADKDGKLSGEELRKFEPDGGRRGPRAGRPPESEPRSGNTPPE